MSPDAPSTRTLNEVPFLQLGLQYEPENAGQVRQHKHVAQAHQRRISVTGKRILAQVFSQIKEDDTQLRDYYQVRVASIVEGTEMGTDSVYSFLREALYELAHVTWEFQSEDKKEWYILHLLDTTKSKRVGFKDGVITIILNPQLAPFFIDIAGRFSTYKLEGYLDLHSWYSMRLFEILSSFRDTGWWQTSIEEYRKLMDCGVKLDQRWGTPIKGKGGKELIKYPDVNLLIAKTVLTAQKELDSTECAFTYSPVLEASRTGRGRKKIVGLRFDLKKVQLKAIPPAWMEIKALRTVITNLRSFRVTDENIAQYLPTVGSPEAAKLVREWQLKENSQSKIDDKVKYCNSVFVKVAKKKATAQREEALQAKKLVRAIPGLF